MSLAVSAARTAREICEAQITTTRRALLEKNFELMLSQFALPCVIETFTTRCVIATRDDLRHVFDSVCKQHDMLGVTDLQRNCVAAEFRSERILVSTHEARMLRGTHLLQEPYVVLAISHFTDGAWRITENAYALDELGARRSAERKGLSELNVPR